MEAVQVLSNQFVGRPAAKPVDAPPVGPARARQLRLLQLREQLHEGVDVDAVATAIARRAQFTRELAERLAGEAARERL